MRDNKLKMKMRRSFRYNKSAVSSVITIAGIMAIIIMAIGALMNTLVPQWANEDESEHMDDVLRSYLILHTNVANLIEKNDYDLTTTQLMKLGASGNVPIGVMPSSGKLTMNPLGNMTEEQINQLDDPLSIYGKGGGNLEYVATNYYFDDQTIVFEHGAVLLAQASGAVMKAGPDLSVIKYPLLNDTRSYGYFDPGTKENPDEIEFTFPGRHSNLTLSYEIFDVDAASEVILKLNGYVIALAPTTADETWTGPHTQDLSGDLVNDFTTNRLEFNHTTPLGADAEWGVRNVTIYGNDMHIELTMVSLIGARDDITGRESHTVHTKLLASELNSYKWPSENLTLNFTTRHPEAWSDYLNMKLNESSARLNWFPNPTKSDFYISTHQVDEEYYIVSVRFKEVNQLDCTLANIKVEIS